jgi:hypothetical protein
VNISEAESQYEIMAKTCGCKDKNRKVTYSFIDTYHSLCHDKKDIILGEIEACERLLKYTPEYSSDEIDRKVIEREIDQLKMALDLMQ